MTGNANQGLAPPPQEPQQPQGLPPHIGPQGPPGLNPAPGPPQHFAGYPPGPAVNGEQHRGNIPEMEKDT
jgi:glucose repression regulatory protein TUP1